MTLPKHQIFIIKLIQHVDTQATKPDPVAPSNYSATLPENEHDWLENPPFPIGNTSTHMVMFFHNLFHCHVSFWGYITLGNALRHFTKIFKKMLRASEWWRVFGFSWKGSCLGKHWCPLSITSEVKALEPTRNPSIRGISSLKLTNIAPEDGGPKPLEVCEISGRIVQHF